MIGGYKGFTVRNRPHNSGRKLGRLGDRLQQWVEAAKAEVVLPMKGVTADGHVVPGLYSIQPTGISTRPLIQAAEAYLGSLTPEQGAAGTFSIESEQWRLWSNVSPFMLRHGVLLEEMSDAQRELALKLVGEGLSRSGFDTARGVMKLNDFVGEVTGRWDEYGEWVYWLSIFGAPSSEQPWGWQIDGHHLNVNFFILGDQVVMTPTFMGSEPVDCETGKHAGTRVFQTEEAQGLALMRALAPAQQSKATLGMELPEETSNFHDNDQIPYLGVPYDELSSEQQGLLRKLIETYVGYLRPGHAAARLEEVKRHLPATHFAWAGGWDDPSPFYYRIYNPVILIEFDHKNGIAFDNEEPTRNHIHTVVRTPNGNDYGKDLLRQHYERFRHVNGAHMARTSA